MGVALGDGQVGAGLVLHVSKRIRDGIIVGYFDRLFPSAEAIDIEDLDIPFPHLPQYTAAQIVREGDWPVVGRRPDLTGPGRVPLLRVVAHLYRGDELIGRVAGADLAK